ncbi:hypothetical protein [Pseudomonas sp. FP1742]|uniref:hypothetical protein n=1 Tax=Pseudomonas sp. FP1742 TaxID=2954079 RepID=UPI00273606C7|nr:hypothetical protein [Pseudomonas sp. FP1742]WLG49085.1 hypothetical protein PSH64_20415 [Pseudomonas sp. FP1742]
MAKRVSKAEKEMTGWLFMIALIVGVPIYLFDKMNKTIGWQIPTLIVVGFLLLLFLNRWSKKRARLRYLRDKYQDEHIVQNILAKRIWIGQTSEQLTDSLGYPAATDHKLLKTKTRDVWKYRHQGANRYGLRITVENDEVTGWDSKSS